MILASSEIAGCILWRNARLPPPLYISDSGHRARKSTRLSHQGPASEIKATVSPAGRGSPPAHHIKAFSSSSCILLLLRSTLSCTTRRAFIINRIRVS